MTSTHHRLAALGLCLALCGRAEAGAPPSAPAALPDPPDGVVGLLAGSALGWSNQVNREGHLTLHVGLEALARSGPLRLGLFAGAGLIGGDYWTNGLEAGLGPSWRVGSRGRLEVLPTLGLLRFGHVNSSEDGLFGTTSERWGGRASVPAAGLRVTFGIDRPIALRMGLVAQQTLRPGRAAFTSRQCAFSCVETRHEVVYDGLALGFFASLGPSLEVGPVRSLSVPP